MYTRHVSYLWEDSQAPTTEVDLLVYRSNLLGSDLRVTNYAGGNTSAKVDEIDPVTGETVQVLWVKASGGDLGTLTRDKLAALRQDRMAALEGLYRGHAHEDEMVAMYGHAVWDRNPNAPSIDTPLHSYLPYRHIDHMHPDALIALATAADGQRLVEELYEGELGWIEFIRPGFELGLRLRDMVVRQPDLRGIVLGGHGLINWGDTAKSCYENTLELIDRAAAHLEDNRPKKVFGGVRVHSLDAPRRREQLAAAMPVLRGLTSSTARTIGHARDDETVLEFTGSQDLDRLAAQGTSCPDHFLRTKRRPLVLPLAADADPTDERDALTSAFDRYRAEERSYYDRNARSDSPPFRTPDPVILLWPGVGMLGFAKDKQTARVACEFFVNAINVMRGAESVSSYTGLEEAEAFNIEYWQLEEAKLRRMPPERPLSRRVALVTGAAGGIGEAIVRKLHSEGACVVAADLDVGGAKKISGELGESVFPVEMDVTDEVSVAAAFREAALEFGGVDLVVNNAGITLAGPLTQTPIDDYDKVHAVVDRGSFLVAREAARQMVTQGLGGDIVYIVSKNALAAGAGNIAYGAAKAAQLHQMRLAAVDLASDGIRVNAVNPDAVVRGSKLFEGEWGRKRAEQYGVPQSELGSYYAQRSLLKEEILPEDIASAVYVLVSGHLSKTTGTVIPVDGGLPAAFLR